MARRAILTLEACKVAQYPFTDNQPLQQPDWLAYIDAVALDVLHEQSPRQLLKARPPAPPCPPCPRAMPTRHAPPRPR